MKKVMLLMPFIGVITFFSCITDDGLPDPDHGNQAAIYIAATTATGNLTRGPEVEPDDKVVQFRILVFKNNGGTLAYNFHVPDITADSPYKMEILTGTYDFVFIGNEDSDPALSTTLDNLPSTATIDDIRNLSFSSQAFKSSLHIPMSLIETDVQIVEDGKYIIGGVETLGNWKVILERLAVRLDLTITTDSNIKQADFSKLHILNVPVSVPVLERNAAGNRILNGGPGKFQTQPIVYDVSEGENGGFTPAGDEYEWNLERVILPSSVFTPDTEENALTLKIIYGSADPATGVLKTGIDDNYQAPRNTHIRAVMQITPSFEIYLGVQHWDEMLAESVVGMNRALNVSAYALENSLQQGTRARIWFSSNMPQVKIDDYTSTNSLVNSIFKDLAGTGATNLHYSYDEGTGKGSGYMDIMTADGFKPQTGTTNYFIYLDANGLRRQIRIPVSSGGGISSDKLGYFQYVGAFWKDDQVGERVITGSSKGKWWAEVVNGRDWVVLGPGKSQDKDIYTANPGDAEDYPVEGNDLYVEGTGEVYFRIGANSKNPVKGQPRYGRVLIVTDNGTNSAYIYLRQGEEADYLMRPEDRGTSTTHSTEWPSATDSRPRPLAAKILPYNLTALSTFTGGNNVSNHPTIPAGQKAALTEYPTQAGTFFQWAQASSPIRVYHPYYHNTSSLKDWITNTNTMPTNWSDIMAQQETCPVGYRRPQSGIINGGAGNPSGNDTYITGSELTQSLWEDPTTITGTNSTKNTLYGYYADGYFDRREVKDLSSTVSHTFRRGAVYYGTSAQDSRIAYSGCLFFNPYEDSNASVFFPTPGFRVNGDGSLRDAGQVGYYWSASSQGVSGHHVVIDYKVTLTDQNPRAGTNIRLMQVVKTTGAHIRCVKDE